MTARIAQANSTDVSGLEPLGVMSELSFRIEMD